MRLYNSLTKTVDEIKPLDGKTIRIYSCGPTVYERAHVGNLSSFIYADTLRRALKAEGCNVEHVMNITDVDDKTIAASQKEFPDLPPMEALSKLTQKYEQLFMDDLRAVGVDVQAIRFVRATEHIEQMQNLISELLESGVAYEAEDGIYFSIDEYRKRGKKYGQLVEINTEGHAKARINNDEYDKDNPQDFVLWKAQKAGEPAWDFKLADGRNLAGRPGWHIECSAMSTQYLGQPFDIHTGGVDLKFPHHENEIAQSTALDGEYLARVFMHSEHILIDGQKMSKSLNNFLTLEEVKAKGYDPLAFRLLVLEGKYSNQRDFNWELLDAAQGRLNDLRAMAALLWQTRETAGEQPLLENAARRALEAAADDLNLPIVLSIVSEVQKKLETNLLSIQNKTAFIAYIDAVDNLLGLDLSDATDIGSEQKALIAEREEARKDQDWAKSDELRDELTRQGIALNDTPSGSVWRKL